LAQHLEAVLHRLFLPSYALQGHSWKAPGEEIAVLAANVDSCLSADAPRWSKSDCSALARILVRI